METITEKKTQTKAEYYREWRARHKDKPEYKAKRNAYAKKQYEILVSARRAIKQMKDAELAIESIKNRM